MADQYRHKRYIRIRKEDSSLVTFTSTSDARTKCGPKSCFDTSSPTQTFSLEDSDQTLVMQFEFDTLEEQTAFKEAVDAVYDDGSGAFVAQITRDQDMMGDAMVEHFKTEWLNQDGSVSSTSYPNS